MRVVEPYIHLINPELHFAAGFLLAFGLGLGSKSSVLPPSKVYVKLLLVKTILIKNKKGCLIFYNTKVVPLFLNKEINFQLLLESLWKRVYVKSYTLNNIKGPKSKVKAISNLNKANTKSKYIG